MGDIILMFPFLVKIENRQGFIWRWGGRLNLVDYSKIMYSIFCESCRKSIGLVQIVKATTVWRFNFKSPFSFAFSLQLIREWRSLVIWLVFLNHSSYFLPLKRKERNKEQIISPHLKSPPCALDPLSPGHQSDKYSPRRPAFVHCWFVDYSRRQS